MVGVHPSPRCIHSSCDQQRNQILRREVDVGTCWKKSHTQTSDKGVQSTTLRMCVDNGRLMAAVTKEQQTARGLRRSLQTPIVQADPKKYSPLTHFKISGKSI